MRVGLLGVAHLHADGYVHNLRAAGAEVVGAADDDALRGRRWAQAHGVAWFSSHEELLDVGPDAVVVCAETAHHRRLVELAADAGAGVLCEKPLATTAADARAVVAACERAGVALMTAFPMRFSAPLRAVRDLVADGTLGTVYCASGTNQGQLPMRQRAWFADPVLAGGGAVMDHTVHLADVLRWSLGQEVVEVYATTNRILHGVTVAVETGGLVVLTFTDGAFASIDCSWSKPDGYPTWGGLELSLVGELGVVSVDAFSQHLVVYGARPGSLSWPGWGSDANQAMVDEFLAAVRQQRPPAVTGVDGLRATEVALAAYASDRAGQPVRLQA